MNTKEAIEVIKRFKNLELYSDMGYVFEADNIIALLKRGEKFEKMWEEFKEKQGYLYFNQDDFVIETINKYEQKYFPKEASQDYPESEE